jgi:GT2 family glycosyltransferase
VGSLDERFSVGMFEDDDYSLRVRQAGHRIIAAEDCFVHHFGNGSFGQLPNEEYERIFRENLVKFESKWNRTWKAHVYRPGVSDDRPRFAVEDFR